jgi:hypothetical protein
VLVVALVVGYTVRALHDDDHPAPTTPAPSLSRSR